MIRHEAPPHPRFFRSALAALAVAVLSALGPTAGGQEVPEDPLAKILTTPEKVEKAKSEADRPPLEFSRSQVMPNDVLPFVKANHWSMFALEMRANRGDYEGTLQTDAILLGDRTQEVTFRRDARLVKGQRTRLTMPVFLPQIPERGELPFRLIRPDSIREDEHWLASCRVMGPHQQMVVVLARESNDAYLRWNSFRATVPGSARQDDPVEVDRSRYYRMVLPLDPEKPLLSPHPLTWTPISHVIWDGLEPEKLNVAQQQAMVDWIHWGGQLIIAGGAGPTFAPLRESFLAPYLPADASGENVTRGGEQLKPLTERYLPPAPIADPSDVFPYARPSNATRYRPPAPIRTSAGKPIYIAALRPKPGATAIPLGGPDDPPLGVEWRVGRGRVLMLGVGLTDPDLVGWPGFDTLLRRVVLRRPEELNADAARPDWGGGGPFNSTGTISLVGPDLTWVRYLSRDLGAPSRHAGSLADPSVGPSGRGSPPTGFQQTNPIGAAPAREVPVGEWLDASELPALGRLTLEEASGIEVPSSRFVLRVILGYIVALVPLNWLLCRYVLRRREWAWVVAPLLALGVAVMVERAAVYDVGYDSACDEIDILETHGDHPRGHTSRFVSLFATGRVRFSMTYPGDSSALALPMSTSGALRGGEAARSTFQALPMPELAGFQVEPRSLALFRAEQMTSLPGTVSLSTPGPGPRMIVNRSGLDLRDAWIIEVLPRNQMRSASIGEIKSGAQVTLPELIAQEPAAAEGTGQLSPAPFLDAIRRSSVAATPEEVGELRLVAWSPRPLVGQSIDPAPDRHRGFAIVVAHLAPAPLPDPASGRYNALASSEIPSPPATDGPATRDPRP
ncbi:hypothetical protein TA3x_003109 [Tundrisphaera sp. TA3]|uniref:hypothetical protein n=1 Tax=Tundrisphaera sp. TA3 TaxID=3435775 RepID=UPI003EBA52BA